MTNNPNKYNYVQIQQDYDSGLSFRDLCTKYGMSLRTLVNAGKRGDFVPRTQSKSQRISQQRCPRTHTIETKRKLRQHMLRRLQEGTYPTLGKNFKNRPQSYPEQWWESVINDRFQDKSYITEHPIGIYSLDFAWISLKKCIEIDGLTHESTIEKDTKRDKWLESNGWKTLRIKWKECVKDKEYFIQLAIKFIED